MTTVFAVALSSHFLPKTGAQNKCSDECRKEDMRRRSRQGSIAKAKADKSARPCAECGAFFQPAYGEKNRTYCSPPCAKRSAHRAGKQKRDARVKAEGAETVYAIRILDRDGWTCQICGVPTPRELRGTYEPNAPEVDHIIPLAKGGAHANDNVQCACRSCNAIKSDSLPMAA